MKRISKVFMSFVAFLLILNVLSFNVGLAKEKIVTNQAPKTVEQLYDLAVENHAITKNDDGTISINLSFEKDLKVPDNLLTQLNEHLSNVNDGIKKGFLYIGANFQIETKSAEEIVNGTVFDDPTVKVTSYSRHSCVGGSWAENL
ncbi:hypothetical protein ACFP7A_09035 [Sporolactobacillus kofuensis]|uniref:Uncharacterized protein n=1 Tax=Sporolactobacillus kofuensis TaxID=269672 RepID=A0ABW1WH21_9BACL|nr:hypothetical protein [Sporolactobacillus kofuensis]MCO7176132.1 hypothetical protein [Sporolactobacillus kofuensis]